VDLVNKTARSIAKVELADNMQSPLAVLWREMASSMVFRVGALPFHSSRVCHSNSLRGIEIS
jgi:hypothetical protein